MTLSRVDGLSSALTWGAGYGGSGGARHGGTDVILALGLERAGRGGCDVGRELVGHVQLREEEREVERDSGIGKKGVREENSCGGGG